MQRGGKALKDVNGGVLEPALEPAHISTIDSSVYRQVLLRERPTNPKPTKISRNERPHFHAHRRSSCDLLNHGVWSHHSIGRPRDGIGIAK